MQIHDPHRLALLVVRRHDEQRRARGPEHERRADSHAQRRHQPSREAKEVRRVRVADHAGLVGIGTARLLLPRRAQGRRCGKGRKRDGGQRRGAAEAPAARQTAPARAVSAAATPKISTGTLSGMTSSDRSRPPRRTPTVAAAPIAPISVSAGVPTRSDRHRPGSACRVDREQQTENRRGERERQAGGQPMRGAFHQHDEFERRRPEPQQVERAVLEIGLEQPIEAEQASRAARRSTGSPARSAPAARDPARSRRASASRGRAGTRRPSRRRRRGRRGPVRGGRARAAGITTPTASRSSRAAGPAAGAAAGASPRRSARRARDARRDLLEPATDAASRPVVGSSSSHSGAARRAAARARRAASARRQPAGRHMRRARKADGGQRSGRIEAGFRAAQKACCEGQILGAR